MLSNLSTVEVDPNLFSECESCGLQMNVADLEPFTNVQCPNCNHQYRVKRRLDQYEILKRQGVGGMSLVFRAEDVELGREVAIKILNENYSADEKRIQQFEQEAKLTAGISHPHVVRVYTVGFAYNRYYIAMELVKGSSLESMMEERENLPNPELSEEALLPIFLEVAEGLQAAYEVGLIHRDMKPGNILIDHLGKAKIVDFGLALVTQGGAAVAEEIWATPYYVPPEALGGQPEDFRSDIYALCTTLYHAIAGKPPISIETRQITELRELKKTVPSLKEVAPWVSDVTCDIVDKGMKYDPDDRYSSYDELIEALSLSVAVMENGGVIPESYNQSKGAAKASSLAKKLAIPTLVGVGVLGVGAFFLTKSLKKDDPADAPPVVAVTTDSTPTANSDKLNDLYDQALKHMKNRAYSKSINVLGRIMNNRSVPEPAASYSGLHMIIAQMLRGETTDARKSLSALEQHVNEIDDQDNETVQEMRKLINSMRSLNTIPNDVVSDSDDVLSTMSTLLAGLKSWEQFRWDDAEKALTHFSQKELDRLMIDREYFILYQVEAQKYLHDMKVMRPWLAEAKRKISTIDAGRINIQEYTALRGQLKSDGARCRWMIDRWIGNTKKQMAFIKSEEERIAREKEEANPKIKLEVWDEVLAEVTPHIDDMKYLKVIARINGAQFVDKENAATRDEYIYLCKKAKDFVNVLDDALSNVTASFKLETKEGVVYSKIHDANEKGMSLSADADPEFVKWKDIVPDNLLAMHVRLSDKDLTPAQKDLRLEQAICFAYLAGEKEKANTAATSLKGRNEGFKTRWERCMAEIGGEADEEGGH